MTNQVTNEDIMWYAKCDCGAITFQTQEGTYSCKLHYFKKHFPNVDLRKCKSVYKGTIIAIAYCCNHCVNGYGLDLCSCGSKEKVGHCECGSTQPMQMYGKYERVVAENPWGRR